MGTHPAKRLFFRRLAVEKGEKWRRGVEGVWRSRNGRGFAPHPMEARAVGGKRPRTPVGSRAVGGKRPRGSYFYRERVVLWGGDFGIITAHET